MGTSSDELVPVFIPALVGLFILSEDEKGAPLTPDEVLTIRDNAVCMMMPLDEARRVDAERGYPIDPANCWYDWQMARREMGRLPDLDPGPRLASMATGSDAYQRTIDDAQLSLVRLRELLPADGSPLPNALIKLELVDGDRNAFMWMNNTARNGDDFTAELFELPETISTYQMDQRYLVKSQDVLDWMVNEAGRLHGGFSMRLHRKGLPDAERAEFDNHLGVTEYV